VTTNSYISKFLLTMMTSLISLEANIDNSGNGEMVSVGFIHANISYLACG